jgi:lysophospholipase L1-like esterase
MRRPTRPRLTLLLAAAAAAVLAVPVAAGAAPAAATDGAVGTWASSPVQGAPGTGCAVGAGEWNGGTIRDVVYPSVSGDRVRIRLSNAFGTAPLTVGAASLAKQLSGAQVVAGSRTPLRFGGRRTVTIPAGAEAVSDWVDYPLAKQQTVSVSLYVPSLSGPATFHPLAVQDNWLSGPGNFTTSTTAADFPTTSLCWIFLDGLDVQPAANVTGSVVAFGDSITDGYQSGWNANNRWPNVLGRRLAARTGKTLSVVDEGISGNQVLGDAGTAGVSALARFGRDVVQQPGAKVVIVLEGINDIGQSDLGTVPTVTAADLIAAYRQLIAQAHAGGLRIVGATLTPFKGSFYWSAAGERTREAVNKWILTSGAFDATVDFAAVTANPDDPQVFDPVYDSGDHLHPSDAGYTAMGDAIDLATLIRG